MFGKDPSPFNHHSSDLPNTCQLCDCPAAVSSNSPLPTCVTSPEISDHHMSRFTKGSSTFHTAGRYVRVSDTAPRGRNLQSTVYASGLSTLLRTPYSTAGRHGDWRFANMPYGVRSTLSSFDLWPPLSAARFRLSKVWSWMCRAHDASFNQCGCTSKLKSDKDHGILPLGIDEPGVLVLFADRLSMHPRRGIRVTSSETLLRSI